VIYGDLIEPSDLSGFVQCDVSSWESQLRLFESAVEQLGRIDVVIANAGIANYEAFNDFEDGEDTSPPLCLWSLLC
jgi:NAD(P)-dependent dehydrogenase (short-subunit alcohol dehydrogenase family)